MLISDTSMTLQAATGLPTATAITLTIDATDPVSGAATPNLKEVVTGTLSGTTVSNLLRGQDGTTTQGHASGANVVMWWNANMINDFQTAYLVGHTQLGAHASNLPLTSPKITTGINDSNNNKVLGITATSSAVNQVNIADSATGLPPILSATGSDTNINLQLKGKGNGVADLAIPYKFRWSRNAAATTGNNTFSAAIAFDTKQYDTNTNVVSGVFTAPIAGFYQFNANINAGSGATNQGIAAGLFKNGAEYSRGGESFSSGAGQALGSNVSDVIQLAANDTIDVRAYGTTTLNLNVGVTTNNYFSGVLVSAT